jgi:hypothetical protein
MSSPGQAQPSRTDTNQGRGPRCEESPAIGDEPGFAPQPDPRSDRRRSPHGQIPRMSRRALRTTPVLNEHVFPLDGAEQRTPVREGVGSSRQPLAALQPPRLENCPASSGGHPSTEAMLGRSVLLVGLIGTFHSGLLRTRIRPRWARKSRTRLDCNHRDGPGHTKQPTPDKRSRAGYGRLCEMGNSGQQHELLRLIHSLLWSSFPRRASDSSAIFSSTCRWKTVPFHSSVST